MCGIVGSFGLEPNETWVNSEINHLRLRGPDSAFVKKFSPNAVFGSTRLAMTDPHPRSNQPFFKPELRAALSFNGEIYNYKNLRTELLSAGFNFTTDSDTEVLLVAIKYFGDEVTKKINGMYAFAFYDLYNNELILCKDNLSKKPIFFISNKKEINWSSDINSLIRLKNQKISKENIAQYLNFGYYIDPNTPFENIETLFPGELRRINIKEEKLQSSSIFTDSFESSSSISVRSSIENATRSRVENQNSVAISLSGGIDSTIIAITAKKFNENTVGYTALWNDSDKDRYNIDAKHAESITNKIGINLVNVQMPRVDEIEEKIIQFVKLMGEPNSNPTGLSMINLYKKISEDGHRLVLTGDGADEIFCGYPRYQKILQVQNFLKLNNMFLTKFHLKIPEKNRRLLQILNTQLSNENYLKWSYWHQIFSIKEILNILKIQPNDYEYFNRNQNHIQRFISSKNEDDLFHQMELDRLVWLTMESNKKLDRISMNFSIEARSPFQDYKVISTAHQVLKNEYREYLNKRTLIDSFPEIKGIGTRNDKAGFISPTGHWLRNNSKLIKNAVSYLQESGLFKDKFLSTLEKIPHEGDFRKIQQLWNLVILGYFLKEYQV